MKTLLEKAKAVKSVRGRPQSYDHGEMEELTIAWIRGEITPMQGMRALAPDGKKISGSGFYSGITYAIRRLYAKKKIIISSLK